MKCPKCNETEQLPGARFCHRCGAPLTANPVGANSTKPRQTPVAQNPTPRGTAPAIGKKPSPSYGATGSAYPTSSTAQQSKLKRLLTKLTIITIVILLIAILLLVLKIWTGCLISIPLFLLSIVTGVASIIIAIPNSAIKSSLGVDDAEIEAACDTLSHTINMLLIWNGFWVVAGIICMFAVGWWAVLICGILSIVALIVGIIAMLGALGVID